MNLLCPLCSDEMYQLPGTSGVLLVCYFNHPNLGYLLKSQKFVIQEVDGEFSPDAIADVYTRVMKMRAFL